MLDWLLALQGMSSIIASATRDRLSWIILIGARSSAQSEIRAAIREHTESELERAECQVCEVEGEAPLDRIVAARNRARAG